jgi:hypothetical protein
MAIYSFFSLAAGFLLDDLTDSIDTDQLLEALQNTGTCDHQFKYNLFWFVVCVQNVQTLLFSLN